MNQLITIGKQISDEMLVEYVVNALPKNYKSFVISIGLSEQFPNLVSLIGLLLHDEVR